MINKQTQQYLIVKVATVKVLQLGSEQNKELPKKIPLVQIKSAFGQSTSILDRNFERRRPF